MPQKIKLKKSNVQGKIPSAETMDYGEVYVNYASGSGNAFLATKKYDDTVARFMEKSYGDSVYAFQHELLNGYATSSSTYNAINEYTYRHNNVYNGNANSVDIVGSEILLLDYDNRLMPLLIYEDGIPIVNDRWFRPDRIFYFNSTGKVVTEGTIMKHGQIYDSYEFATERVLGRVNPNKNVYFQGIYDAERDLFRLNRHFFVEVPTDLINLRLRDYLSEDTDYIYVGTSSEENKMSLNLVHKVYRFTDGELIEYEIYKASEYAATALLAAKEYTDDLSITDVQMSDTDIEPSISANTLTIPTIRGYQGYQGARGYQGYQGNVGPSFDITTSDTRHFLIGINSTASTQINSGTIHSCETVYTEEGKLYANIPDYLPLSGSTMYGPICWGSQSALPYEQNPSYFLTVDDIESGGTTKYISKTDLETAIGLGNYATSSDTNNAISAVEYNSRFTFKTGSDDNDGEWTVQIPNVTELYDGLTIRIRLQESYNSTRNYLNVNGLGFKIVCLRRGTSLTTEYARYSELEMTYRTDGCGSGIVAHKNLDGLVSGTTYTDGWVVENVYYRTYVSNVQFSYSSFYAGERITRYQILALNKENRLVPLTKVTGSSTANTGTTKPVIDQPIRPHNFYFYSTTTVVSKGSTIQGTYLYEQYSTTSARYTFNSDLSTYRQIYLKGRYDPSTDLFYLDSSTTTSFYVQVPTSLSSITLSTYFGNGGDDFIYLGNVSNTKNYLGLTSSNHIVYHFDGTNLVEYSNYRINEIESGFSVTSASSQQYLIGISTGNTTFNESNVHFQDGVYMENNTIYHSSDERLKEFGDDIKCNLDEISLIPKKYFAYKNDESKKVQIGTSAQKLMEYYPEAVSVDGNGRLSVSYEILSIVALAAIDKLHAENMELKREIELIKKKLDEK